MKESYGGREGGPVLMAKEHSQGRLKMKRGTDTLQDTAALGFDTAHRISIPT